MVNWTVTCEMPSFEKDTIWSMLGSVETASSSGFVICVSTVAGSAPASVVTIVTPGKLMLGTTPIPIVK